MKKITFLLTAAVLMITGSSFANSGDKVSAIVKASFEKDFTKASAVSWEKVNEFYFASFTLNNTAVDAAYNEEGDLVGTARKIPLAQLPIAVSRSLNKKYDGYIFPAKIVEIEFEGELNYYMTVYNEKQIVKLKCASNGDITVESRKRRK